MKVYVLEVGSYEDRYIYGVYSSLAAAKAAWQPERPDDLPHYERARTYEWDARRRPRLSSWLFDGALRDRAAIEEFVLDAPAPNRESAAE